MENFIIIIPTHSKYLEIVNYFLDSIKKNWSNCPYKIIVSITGENIKIDNCDCIYNGKNASLIDCIVNVSKKHKSNYYISFLGDAFISKKINQKVINDLMDSLKNSEIDYCSIYYGKKYVKEKKYNKFFRYINQLDRYSHNFVAFIVSYNYINSEFKEYKSDIDFEYSYLKKKENFYYSNHLIVNKNYFNIMPSITKGNWDWINYHKLKKTIPNIKNTTFNISSIKFSIYFHIRGIINNHINDKYRALIKRKINFFQ